MSIRLHLPAAANPHLLARPHFYANVNRVRDTTNLRR